MNTFWNERYGQPGYAYGTQPNEFLVSVAQKIPAGRVLCLAEGQGRNAVYLAKLGYEVVAVDLSDVGLAKAASLAAEQGVSLHTQVGNLANFEIQPGSWQGIVSIFGHTPPAVRKPLHRRVVQGLAPGGVFLLEAYTPRQVEIGGIGGPRGEQADMLMSLSELRAELEGLTLMHAAELDRDVNEGQFHMGTGAVVQIVGVKPK
ncbi:MAG: class I SAM-dependent methyltransferase [Acidobacteria bacterium]|nr:class I SAM-dependent methyltransferase [Acidobacteriota bacterium]